MDGDPSGVIARSRGVEAADKLNLARRGVLLVGPDLVGPHVCGIQVRLGRVKHHAVNGRVVLIFVVLNVVADGALLVDGKDVAKAGKIVERIPVDIVRRLHASQYEYGPRLCASLLCLCFMGLVEAEENQWPTYGARPCRESRCAQCQWES